MAPTDSPTDPDFGRAFGGVARLYGHATLERLAGARVVVAGIGGVGSWAVEGLARSGIGQLTLIDMDHVAESNLNRQIHSLHSTLGQSKIAAMAARVADINPACQVIAVDEFVTASNAADIIASDADVVIDAIDQASVKAALIALCRRRRQPVLVCGAAGGRTDPLALQKADLARTTGDPLLARVRSILRRDHGFTRSPKRRFQVSAIYSIEPVAGRRPVAQSQPNRGDLPSSALACAGYGSVVAVTSVMGMAAAAATITILEADQNIDSGLPTEARQGALEEMQAQSGSNKNVETEKRDQPA